MNYRALISLLCLVTAGYAAENNYQHIVDAVNSCPDINAEHQKIFKQVSNLIYSPSSKMITHKQLQILSILELGYLIRHIDCRTDILEKSAKHYMQSNIQAEKERLQRLKSMIETERSRWSDYSVYNKKTGCKEHAYYMYCGKPRSADLPQLLTHKKDR